MTLFERILEKGNLIFL